MSEKVKVVESISQRDYTVEGQIERLKFVGQKGVIVGQHDSHGLCYDVRFSGGTATYDPDELIFTPF